MRVVSLFVCLSFFVAPSWAESLKRDPCSDGGDMAYCSLAFPDLWGRSSPRKVTSMNISGYLVSSPDRIMLFSSPEQFFYGGGYGGVEVIAGKEVIDAVRANSEPITALGVWDMASPCPATVLGEYHPRGAGGNKEGSFIAGYSIGVALFRDPCSIVDFVP